MDQVVPWKGLIGLIEPHYPKGEGGRPAYPLLAMLRVHLMQNSFGCSDPAMEESTLRAQVETLQALYRFIELIDDVKAMHRKLADIGVRMRCGN